MPLVIAGLGIGLFAFCAAFLLIALSQTHTAQHGGSGVAGYLDWLSHGGPFAGLLNLGAKASRAVVSRFAGAQVKHLTAYFGGLAFLIGATYKANANTAVAAADAVQATDHRRKVAVKQLARHEARVDARLHREAHHAEVHARSVAHALNAYKAREAHRIHHLTHAVDVTLPHDIARVRRREEALSRDQAKLRERTGLLERGAEKTFEWIRSHPLSAVTGVFAGAVAVALGRLGFNLFKCRSWRNVGKRLNCGIGSSLLNLLDDGLGGLLGALLTYETVTHLDELVRLGQSVEGGVAKGLQDLLNVKG